MHAPQITLIALFALGLGISLAQHGKPRKPMNAWDSVIGTAATVAILWWGGFWS